MLENRIQPTARTAAIRGARALGLLVVGLGEQFPGFGVVGEIQRVAEVVLGGTTFALGEAQSRQGDVQSDAVGVRAQPAACVLEPAAGLR